MHHAEASGRMDSAQRLLHLHLRRMVIDGNSDEIDSRLFLDQIAVGSSANVLPCQPSLLAIKPSISLLEIGDAGPPRSGR